MNEANTTKLKSVLKDEDYMRAALELAEKGCGRVNPNPLVGAVVVKEDRIIGQGWHQEYGGLHAERNALADCTESPQGASMYVTLEPCCHYGKTPPCTEALIEMGICRVIIGSPDPNPLVAGKGIALLREHGIEVTEGILREECDRMNQVFFHYITHGTPYIIMKYAMSMDGKIACATGKSQWITGEAARRRAHEDRNRYMGIMTGVGTVLADDPMLTCRLIRGRNPIRIICDTMLRTPVTSHIVNSAFEIKTIIATTRTEETMHHAYLEKGCEIMVIPESNGHLDIRVLFRQLGKRGIDSVLLEGGSTLNWSVLQSKMVNKIQTYIAPKLLGGENAKSPIGGLGADNPDAGCMLSPPVITRLGDDLLLESEVISCLQE